MTAHLALVSTSAAPTAPRTDTKLLKRCHRYLLLFRNLARLREAQIEAEAMTDKVLRPCPDDPAAAKLWQRLRSITDADHFELGIRSDEARLSELLTDIISTPARTEEGLRARCLIWRTVFDTDMADQLLDSIMANMASFRVRRRA